MDKKVDGQYLEAHSLAKASCWVSIAGIIVGVVVAAIILGLEFGTAPPSYSYYYNQYYANG